MKTVGNPSPKCATCKVRKCNYPNREIPFPVSCPRLNYAEVREESIESNWANLEFKKINQASDEVLKKAYGEQGPRLTRVEELIEYTNTLGYKKLGIAFCVGLWEEARILTEILEKKGFEVISVCCAAGATLGELGLEQQIECNPLMQAEVLNRENTDLNIMMGLCIGHDILFTKTSNADVTTLVVKDRVTGHNPIVALYTAHSFYRKRFG